MRSPLGRPLKGPKKCCGAAVDLFVTEGMNGILRNVIFDLLQLEVTCIHSYSRHTDTWLDHWTCLTCLVVWNMQCGFNNERRSTVVGGRPDPVVHFGSRCHKTSGFCFRSMACRPSWPFFIQLNLSIFLCIPSACWYSWLPSVA